MLFIMKKYKLDILREKNWRYYTKGTKLYRNILLLLFLIYLINKLAEF